METIKYYNITLLLLILLFTCIGSLAYIPLSLQRETYEPAYIDDDGIDNGYVPNETLTVTQASWIFYNEISNDSLMKMLANSFRDNGRLEAEEVLNATTAAFQRIKSNETELVMSLATPVANALNRQLHQYDKFTPETKFKPLSIGKIREVKRYGNNSYVITTVTPLYRESKRHGIVLEIIGVVDSKTLAVTTVHTARLLGLLPEDRLILKSGFAHEQNAREYGSVDSFARDESIMKSSEYEQQVIHSQADGIKDDRGISSLSFYTK